MPIQQFGPIYLNTDIVKRPGIDPEIVKETSDAIHKRYAASKDMFNLSMSKMAELNLEEDQPLVEQAMKELQEKADEISKNRTWGFADTVIGDLVRKSYTGNTPLVAASQKADAYRKSRAVSDERFKTGQISATDYAFEIADNKYTSVLGPDGKLANRSHVYKPAPNTAPMAELLSKFMKENAPREWGDYKIITDTDGNVTGIETQDGTTLSKQELIKRAKLYMMSDERVRQTVEYRKAHGVTEDKIMDDLINAYSSAYQRNDYKETYSPVTTKTDKSSGGIAGGGGTTYDVEFPANPVAADPGTKEPMEESYSSIKNNNTQIRNNQIAINDLLAKGLPADHASIQELQSANKTLGNQIKKGKIFLAEVGKRVSEINKQDGFKVEGLLSKIFDFSGTMYDNSTGKTTFIPGIGGAGATFMTKEQIDSSSLSEQEKKDYRELLDLDKKYNGQITKIAQDIQRQQNIKYSGIQIKSKAAGNTGANPDPFHENLTSAVRGHFVNEQFTQGQVFFLDDDNKWKPLDAKSNQSGDMTVARITKRAKDDNYLPTSLHIENDNGETRFYAEMRAFDRTTGEMLSDRPLRADVTDIVMNLKNSNPQFVENIELGQHILNNASEFKPTVMKLSKTSNGQTEILLDDEVSDDPNSTVTGTYYLHPERTGNSKTTVFKVRTTDDPNSKSISEFNIVNPYQLGSGLRNLAIQELKKQKGKK